MKPAHSYRSKSIRVQLINLHSGIFMVWVGSRMISENVVNESTFLFFYLLLFFFCREKCDFSQCRELCWLLFITIKGLCAPIISFDILIWFWLIVLCCVLLNRSPPYFFFYPRTLCDLLSDALLGLSLLIHCKITKFCMYTSSLAMLHSEYVSCNVFHSHLLTHWPGTVSVVSSPRPLIFQLSLVTSLYYISLCKDSALSVFAFIWTMHAQLCNASLC